MSDPSATHRAVTYRGRFGTRCHGACTGRTAQPTQEGPPSLMRALLAGAALALLAGCSAPAASPALPPAEAVGGGAGPEAAAPEPPEADGVELGGSCTGPAGIPVSHP